MGRPSVSSSDSLQLSVLLPVVSTVLLLLLVAASFLAWRLVKRQKKGRKAWLGWAEGGAWGQWPALSPGAIWPRGYPHGLERAL